MNRNPSQFAAIDENRLTRIKQASRFIAAGVFILILALIGISGYQLYSINRQIAEKQDKNKQLEGENEQLQAQRQQLGTELQALETQLEQKRAEIASLERQWEVASRQITEQGSFAKTLTGSELRNAPVSMAVHPRASSTPVGNDLFLFKIWLDGADRFRPQIKKVSYFFNHPTFRQKVHESRDPATDFAVEYRGWGALDRVIITIYMEDGTTQEIAFNMLAALRGSSEDTNSDNTRKEPVKRAPVKTPAKRAPVDLPIKQPRN